jgi:hypothetical protein
MNADLKTGPNTQLSIGEDVWESHKGDKIQYKNLDHDHLSNVYWHLKLRLHASGNASFQVINHIKRLRQFIDTKFGAPKAFAPIWDKEIAWLRQDGYLKPDGTIFIGNEFIGVLPPVNSSPLPSTPAQPGLEAGTQQLLSTYDYPRFVFPDNPPVVSHAAVQTLAELARRSGDTQFFKEHPVLAAPYKGKKPARASSVTYDTRLEIISGGVSLLAAQQTNLPLFYRILAEQSPDPVDAPINHWQQFKFVAGYSTGQKRPEPEKTVQPSTTFLSGVSLVKQAGEVRTKLNNLLNLGPNPNIQRQILEILNTALTAAYYLDTTDEHDV